MPLKVIIAFVRLIMYNEVDGKRRIVCQRDKLPNVPVELQAFAKIQAFFVGLCAGHRQQIDCAGQVSAGDGLLRFDDDGADAGGLFDDEAEEV